MKQQADLYAVWQLKSISKDLTAEVVMVGEQIWSSKDLPQLVREARTDLDNKVALLLLATTKQCSSFSEQGEQRPIRQEKTMESKL